MNFKEISMNPPSLCQPDENKSCGACCGLYNYQGTTRQHLERKFVRRTERFRSLSPYTPEDLKLYSQWVADNETEGKLLKTIYNCEFLGFLDASRRRVGCLLHPRQHNGRDLRGCSFYGAALCDGHLCLSYQKLTLEEKWCVVLSLDDWHLYGICITDIDLCKSFFAVAGERLGRQPSLSMISHREVQRAAKDFFSLKTDWPFRTQEEGRFGKYCLAEDEYREASIPYREIGCNRSAYDTFFLCFESYFKNVEEVREAETLIELRLTAFVNACEAVSS